MKRLFVVLICCLLPWAAFAQDIMPDESDSCPAYGSCRKTPPMPSFDSLPFISELPDPFEFMNGFRVTRKKKWSCRRKEISALAQHFIYGIKPPPPERVYGSFNDDRITVTVQENGKTISFACPISYPSAGPGPYPAMISLMSMVTLSREDLNDMGVAMIFFPSDDIAAQMNPQSRGTGKFYDLYGSGHSAGALMAWAWGVSRLIDALENTPAANINAARVGVTGCSRYGKGAMAAGAFDERIALTIPQESGFGGAGSWRVSDYLKSLDIETQTLDQIIKENTWFSLALEQFAGFTEKLPIDQHLVEALCAPRGLFILESDFEWLGPYSCYTTAKAARKVWKALGVPDNMGFSITGNHNHCMLPASQRPEINAFVQKFLLDIDTDTNITRDDLNFTFDNDMWTPWHVPCLH